MQSVSAAWTAEEKDAVRRVVQNTQISWHKQTTIGGRTFTIGVSSIGGNDIIGINPGAIGSPGNYRYFDESDYVTSLGWEQKLNMPVGGLSIGLAEAKLDNTSGRFTPGFMGGHSELYTAILPNRPVILNAGFDLGTDVTIPQFSGVITGQPKVNSNTRNVSLKMQDYINYFQGKYLEQNVMFTAQRTDQVLASLLTNLGMNTAQYDLDYGINVIPFGLFPSGSKFAEVIGKLVQAEAGYFYQDQSGIFRFENRQHWDNAPYTQVQKIIATSQVISSETPGDDHIVNVVEIKGTPRAKQQNQLVWQSSGFAGSGTLAIPPSDQLDVWINFDDPVLAIDTPVPNGTANQTSFFVCNSATDGSGGDLTSSVYVKAIDKFATTAKIRFANRSTNTVYITNLDIWGRPARRSGDVYYRSERGLSVTAYQEKPLTIENEFIQSPSWAASYGEMILKDLAFPENIQTIKIRALPELQLGDLISWQGKYWRPFDIKTSLDPSEGFVQELTLLQRTQTTYFRIGISTIGGDDIISP